MSKPKAERARFLCAGFIYGPYRSAIMLDRTKADDALLLGRIFIAWIFIPSGLRKLMNIDGFAASLTERGVPMAELMAWAGGLVELIGGLAVLIGVQVRFAGVLMILFTLAATLIAHRFWEFDMPARQMQQSQFFKNLAIMGGYLFLIVSGGGRYCLERLWRERPTRGAQPGRRASDRAVPA
jgi:putative oxidoreductase